MSQIPKSICCTLILALSIGLLTLAHASSYPQSVLIATRLPAVDTSGLADEKQASLMSAVYDRFVIGVVEQIEPRLEARGIAVTTHFHRDGSTSMRVPVMEMIARHRFDGVIQLAVDLVASTTENAAYLAINYLPISYEGDGATVLGGYEDKYVIWRDGLEGTGSTSRIAIAFIDSVEQEIFGGTRGGYDEARRGFCEENPGICPP